MKKHSQMCRNKVDTHLCQFQSEWRGGGYIYIYIYDLGAYKLRVDNDFAPGYIDRFLRT